MPTDEIDTLRRAVRDLAALTTLPALWTEYTPQAIAEGLSDVLLSVLNVDVVYVRLKGGDKPIEIVRAPQQLYIGEQATRLGAELDVWEEFNTSQPVQSIANPLGTGVLCIAGMPIGHEITWNRAIVGTRSPDGLTETDLLLLRVAANQSAVALQNARLLTDLKSANQQKDLLLVEEKDSRRKAERAIQERDEFLAVAAHELKTPITSLRGFVQLLLRQLNKYGTVDPDRLQRALVTVEDQSTKLTALVAQLLDLSRIEAGRLTVELKETNIAALVSNVATTLQKNTSRHSIAVESPHSILGYVDSLRLEQVVINLIDNAIKYSPEGGPIDICVSMIDHQTVQISVTDRGMGIPTERRQYIFDRFYQAHVEGYREGMGLGLYISNQIVELHNGTLKAEFPEAGGTRFIILLPTGSSTPIL